MQEFVKRIKAEFEDLTDNIRSLTSFIGSEEFGKTSSDEQALMKLQLRQMEAYASTLRRRLEFYSVRSTDEELEATLDSLEEEDTND